MKIPKLLFIVLLHLSLFSCSDEPIDIINPSIPTLLAPKDLANKVDVDFTFMWTNDSYVDNSQVLYDLYVGKSSDKLEMVANDITALFYNYTLDFETTYYWQVISKENNLKSKSILRSFVTQDKADFFNVNSLPANEITASSFIMMASADEIQGTRISKRGFLWDTKATDLSNTITLASDQVDFNYTFKNVKNNISQYYFQAFTLSEKGINYGEILSVSIPNSLLIIIKNEDGTVITDAIVKHFFNNKIIDTLKSNSKGELTLENINLGENKFEVFSNKTLSEGEKEVCLSSSSIIMVNGENSLLLLPNMK